MAVADRMIQTTPSQVPMPQDVLVACIRACVDCAQACTACADACLGEQDPTMLVRCIRLDADCADVCAATGRIMSRETAFDPQMARAILHACVVSCKLCGDECAQHAQRGMRHCQVCMETCRRCEQACNAALTALPP